MAGNKNRVEKLVERLKGLGENESLPMRATESLDEGFTAEIGYYGKNNRGSYQIKLKYGITGLLKIRNKTDFENIKTLVEFLEKNPEYIKAIEQLNGGTKKTKTNVEYV